MKSKTLKQMKDGQQFRISKRTTGAVYELVRKWKATHNMISTSLFVKGTPVATISSITSKRSFIKEQSLVVYPV